jgi:RNA polymerase sigma factor (sigma-70 family)
MPRDRFGTFLGELRRAALRREAGRLTDGQLLERYVRLGDEAAFEALVRQHGTMVLGVCRRVLRHWHDAEDAFQATFLVLARKAASVRPPDRVGNYLYGVAYRTALEARRSAARRRLKEACAPPPVEQPADDTWAELRPVLDRELAGLPEKYRAPLVLCDLEGRTRTEAARQLGWREGTLSGRLARARVLLARRLRRHGLGVAGGALAAVLCREAAAGVPGPLLVSTVKAAALVAAGEAAALPANLAALVEGVNRAMGLSRLKVVALGLLVAGALGGVGVLAHPGRGTAQDQAAPQVPPAGAPRTAEPGPVPRAPAPEPPHVIAPPDLVRVRVIRSEEMPWGLERLCLVRPGGTIDLGDLGTLSVAGQSADDVRDAIARRLKERVPTGRLTHGQVRGQVLVDVVISGDGALPVVETRTKVYHVKVTVVQVDPEGPDLGELGKGKVLASPRLGLQEGKEGSFRDGGEQSVPGAGDGKVEFVEFGRSVRVTVRGLPDGRLRLDALLERSEPEQAGGDGVRIRARSVRAIERVKLGEAVKLVDKDDRGEPRHLAVVRVVSVEDVRTRSRSVPAERGPGDAARVGQILIIGNENVKQDVILRQIPLAPGQVLTSADLRAAERNLEKLGLFRVEPEKGIRPTVRVVDSSNDSGFKDIVVTVEEKPAAGPPPR